MSHMIQDIAVLFDDSPHGLTTLETAARLASKQKAKLIGITTTDKGEATLEDGFARGKGIADVIHKLKVSTEEHLRRRAEKLTSTASRHGISSEFRTIPYFDDGKVDLNSLYSDLVVVGASETPGAPFGWSYIKALQRTGIPLVIVPQSWGDRPIGRKITVAWNASRQARRAVADAFPLLLSADTVDLLIVDPEHNAEMHGKYPGADMATYLAHHGVEVKLRRTFSQGKSIAEVIVANAVVLDSDLIVFGAYSRSQISEAVLGGVSRTLLAEVPLPLFVSC
ncbi:universal stress protein [Azospira sp. I09]|uniref:universal stress protein n=1 Tax=Azospira sp. I09 TaxID=1765049 RepID=UPI001261046C|nr:universal stress protein [Azospira sp. I09]BBN90452.1 universal stress protein A [Azospira sp. I09]